MPGYGNNSLHFESNIITIQGSQARVTTSMSKSSRRQKSNCPISFSLELFGDRWTLLILRDLILHGKTRFAEFQGSREKIASNILTDRLRRMEAQGLIARQTDPADARKKIYTATPKGQSLTPVLLEIAAWGAAHDPHTGAPDGFSEEFYADRAAFYRDHRRRIEVLVEKQNTE